jgi:hypothetical protein
MKVEDHKQKVPEFLARFLAECGYCKLSLKQSA